MVKEICTVGLDAVECVSLCVSLCEFLASWMCGDQLGGIRLQSEQDASVHPVQ